MENSANAHPIIFLDFIFFGEGTPSPHVFDHSTDSRLYQIHVKFVGGLFF